MEPLGTWSVHIVFIAVIILCIITSEFNIVIRLGRLLGVSGHKTNVTHEMNNANDKTKGLQMRYLIGLVMFQAGDWLQGPYMYALYDAYGYSHEEIAALFVAGFGSSAVFGTFVGSLADTIGRKRGALLYVLTYVASCATKHWNSYRILMVGRVLGGISTSLLFSVFDSWLVSEHTRLEIESSVLSNIFANAQAANSVVAILSGIFGEWLADLGPLVKLSDQSKQSTQRMNEKIISNDGSIMAGGYCTPFDAAGVVLLLGGTYISMAWSENYGGHLENKDHEGRNGSVKDIESSVFSSLKSGFITLFRDRRILLIGTISAFFEAAMYSFVFEWTPAVKATPTDTPPYGEIFSIMMLACAAGTRIYSNRLSSPQATHLLVYVFALGGLALAIPAFPKTLAGKRAPLFCLVAFVLFEVVVGIYFPSVSTLKSKLVPDAQRSTIYNLFRIPLNGLVLIVLLSNAPGSTIFFVSSVLIFITAFLYKHLIHIIKSNITSESAFAHGKVGDKSEHQVTLPLTSSGLDTADYS
mmetsp:Transcript_16100/g.21078  ORF Transcript_16100/g.21078 Transcript_16100/m.21078 type:complete len:526 (-) Transcript_16100:670-2247(-)